MLHSITSSHSHPKKLTLTFLIILLTTFNHLTQTSSTTRSISISSPSPSPSDDIDHSTEFIKTSCGSTTYPDLCYNTLSIFATKIQTSSRLLTMTSLAEALKTVRSAAEAMTSMSQSGGVTGREAAALTDCVEEMSDAADGLIRSVAEMGEDGGSGSGSEFRVRMGNVQTWVSAALTYEDTCLDGFSESESESESRVVSEVRDRVAKVSQMISNGLALVNRFANDQ